MRLLDSEHEAFQGLISQLRPQLQIKTWKKRGWVHYQDTSSGKIIKYHRKKTSLIRSSEFEDVLTYFIQIDGNQEEYSSTKEVFERFSDWLKTLQE